MYFGVKEKAANPDEYRVCGKGYIIPTLFRLTLNKAEKCFFSAEYVANLNNFSAIFSVK
nr:MAG TPA: hypothetical protein [Caudoviricetes sp.]